MLGFSLVRIRIQYLQKNTSTPHLPPKVSTCGDNTSIVQAFSNIQNEYSELSYFHYHASYKYQNCLLSNFCPHLCRIVDWDHDIQLILHFYKLQHSHKSVFVTNILKNCEGNIFTPSEGHSSTLSIHSASAWSSCFLQKL